MHLRRTIWLHAIRLLPRALMASAGQEVQPFGQSQPARFTQIEL